MGLSSYCCFAAIVCVFDSFFSYIFVYSIILCTFAARMSKQINNTNTHIHSVWESLLE